MVAELCDVGCQFALLAVARSVARLLEFEVVVLANFVVDDPVKRRLVDPVERRSEQVGQAWRQGSDRTMLRTLAAGSA